jgi:hypothetical protein
MGHGFGEFGAGAEELGNWDFNLIASTIPIQATKPTYRSDPAMRNKLAVWLRFATIIPANIPSANIPKLAERIIRLRRLYFMGTL